MAHPVIDFVVTPAFVSGIVTWLVSQRFEGLKARRDFNTRIAENARDVIKEATKAAVEYFSTPVADRTLTQEAVIIVADRDVEASVGRVRASAPAAKIGNEDRLVGERLLNFQALLTGGSFQQRSGEDLGKDADQIRRLAAEAAALQNAVTALRDSQLYRGTFGYTVAHHTQPFRAWWSTQRGIDDISA